MLQDNVDGYRREIASLRDTNQKVTTANQKHEQVIHTLTEDLREAKEKLTVADVSVFGSGGILITCSRTRNSLEFTHKFDIRGCC